MTDDTQSQAAERIYAIGDIHGRRDLLDRAIAAIERDVAKRGPAALTVTVGDYIDRGPDSRGVIDRLAENPFPTPYVALKGNHEDILETFLTDPETGPYWREQGGHQTLKSYGVHVGGISGVSYAEARNALRRVMPAEHVEFLRSLKMSYCRGKYFFCHAGVRPRVPLDRQREEDLLWIRGDFLASGCDFGKVVVHGHTPVEEPQVLPNRIDIDTGAFATGRLTCVALEDGVTRFLDV